jgi:phosphatidylserine/phosphatidylglycerophosphate/cardiolipin synthase-like enzyme
MRKVERANGVTVKAYAGSTGVLLAMDVTDAKRRGLLGFAIERAGAGGHRWLNGLLHFGGRDHGAGEPVETRRAPIQKFRWSDYTVFENKRYRYTVHPVYGTPDDPRPAPGPTVEVKTHSLASGAHSIVFNRAAAASQAFTRDFPEVEAAIDAARKAKRPQPPLPAHALEWLSRGVLEQIVGFVDGAKPGEALDIAIYEYELHEIVEAVERAHKRGVNVRIVYHAQPGDEQTEINRASAANLPDACKRERVTSKIHHNKFIVHSRMTGGDRKARAVLCGSTNFTENGVYRQGNVVHVVRMPAVATTYLDLFEELFATPDEVAKTRAYVNANNALPAPDEIGVFAGFSPRSKPDELDRFSEIVGGAKKDVLFCTAFDLYDPLEHALLGDAGDPILRYGIQNSRSKITGFHADRGADFNSVAMLNKGLEGFLKESTKGQRGNILIHTKLVVVDFTSEDPTVISGSHNMSAAASKSNDENYLIVRGDTDIADCYGVELMRLYDHYRFRNHVRTAKATQARPLAGSDAWTADYFKAGSLKRLDRLRFAGK